MMFRNVCLKCLVNEISYANVSKWEIYKSVEKECIGKYNKMKYKKYLKK